MKVLYVGPYPVPLSETYTATEIEWMRAQGVDVHIWSKKKANAPAHAFEQETIGGTLGEVVDKVKPDIIHAHWLDAAYAAREIARARNIPLTLRGHSVDFDEDRYRGLADIARVWLFPHLAALFTQPNIEALPVAYDGARFIPQEPDPRRYVVRAGFCNGNKDLDTFFTVARACHKVAFVLVITGSRQDLMTAAIQSAPTNVTVYRELPSADAAAIVSRAWLCFRGHDPNAHVYGMPISIAEAMGAGLPVLARATSPGSARFGPESYADEAGYYYSNPDEAAIMVMQIVAWSRQRWNLARQRSLARARLYHAAVVLPRMLAVWRDLTDSKA